MTGFYKALALHQDRRFLEALEAYNEVLVRDPWHVNALNNRSCVYDDMGIFELAIKDLDRAITICPWNDMPFLNRGRLHKIQGLYDEAIRDYTTAIVLNPGNSVAYEDRGGCYVEKGLYAEAVYDYRKMIDLKYPEYNPHELVTFFSSDHLPEAKDAIRKLLNAGFYLNCTGSIHENIIIMPRSCDRIVLKFDKLHAGKTIRRHLRQNESRYELRYDTDFEAIMDALDRHYQKKGNAFLSQLRYFFTAMRRSTASPRVVTVALYKDGKLVAGDLGVEIGKVYTSYTGYHDAPSAGTAQLILLARLLKEKGFAYWDFGPNLIEYDSYRVRLGAERMGAKGYFSLFHAVNPGSAKLFARSKSKKGKKNG